MDKEVTETLAYFCHHASELRNLGQEWGLTEEEIEECIEQAMSVDPKKLPAAEITTSTTLKFAARKTWPKFRIFLAFVGVMIVLIGLGSLAMQNEEVDLRVGQIIQPLMYPVFRLVRLATVSLHDKIDLYEGYMEECLVKNPLFSKETMLGIHACENCESVTAATQFTAASLDKGHLPAAAFTEPVLFKDKGRNVSLETFQSILSKNPFIQNPMLGLKTNLKWASHVKDLLNKDVADKLAAQPDFYFFWISKLVWTSQIMRKVFPKPAVLGNDAEIAIRKNIYLTGPKAASFELPPNTVGMYNWYIQGSGSRKLLLTPINMCRKECSPISVTLYAGDLLTYNSEIYTATVLADGDDISIAFLGHFNPLD